MNLNLVQRYAITMALFSKLLEIHITELMQDPQFKQLLESQARVHELLEQFKKLRGDQS